jgi:hypothetical protein
MVGDVCMRMPFRAPVCSYGSIPIKPTLRTVHSIVGV